MFSFEASLRIRKFKTLGLSQALIICLSNQIFATEYNKTDCLSIPEKEPLIKACVKDEILSITGKGFGYHYNYEEYHAKLSDLITDWFRTNKFEQKIFCNQEAEFIFSVPEITPHKFALRIQMEILNRKIMFAIPGVPKLWHEKPMSVKVFDEGDSYPASYGYEAGNLLAKRNKNIENLDLVDFLIHYDAGISSDMGNQWLTLKVPIMGEVSVLKSMQLDSDFSHFFANISTNNSYEWMSYKASFGNIEINCN